MITDPQISHGPFGTVFLKRTGLRCSRICMGTMTFGAQLNEKESHVLLDMAFERGIFFFDTANAYSAGESEAILGKWAKQRRDRVVIGTKIRYQIGDDPMSVGLSRRTVRNEVEKSLRRLQTDYVDILYLHQPDYETDLEETLHAVHDLVREGKVHVLGLSNFAAWQLMKSHWIADRRSLTAPTIVQPIYNLVARSIEQELLPCCRDLNLSVYTYNPLAAGILSGKHSPVSGVQKGGRFDVFPYYQDRYWHESMFNALKELKDLAARCGRSLIGLSLNWLLHRPGITGIILGASRSGQLKENLDALGDPLPEEIQAACDTIWHHLKGKIPDYNR
ncbi:aldo/keto reductase [bacterium]|nr:aldo/keto reductase [candidate division CSSED10-310 bacterium]